MKNPLGHGGDVSGGTHAAFGYRYQYLATAEPAARAAQQNRKSPLLR